MNVLICGADGFIGRHLCEHLRAAGHRVLRGVRRPRTADDIAIDYTRDHSSADWLPRLTGIDVVINAVGILIETPAQPFAAIHTAAPGALFDACATVGGIRAIQISALGVDDGKTPYFRTKLAADTHLAALPLDWAILRPGLIYGIDGGSSQVFRLQASLPVIALPGKGDQALQPIHIDDLCACVLRLVESEPPLCRIYELGGAQTLSYRELLTTYRRAMGMGDARFVPVPMALMRLTARLAEYLPQRVLSRDTLTMLAGGNTTTDAAARQLLGKPPRPVEEFIPPAQAAALRHAAVADWTQPLLHIALAIMWLCGGIVSLLNQTESYALLGRIGLHGGIASLLLYAASMLDVALGVLTLWRPSRSLWLSQIGLVAVYTVLISVFLPQQWLHPFGPVVKNLPILVMLLALHANAGRRC